MSIRDKMHDTWNPIKELLDQEPLLTLNKTILPNISFQPKKEDIFNVFSMSIEDVKVVILGQDPYPTPGDAVGYAFVNGRNKIPKSLEIIEREIEMQTSYSSQGIETWIEQGIFLLNTALTVETEKAGSHLKYWKAFTGIVLNYMSQVNKEIIYVLWGKHAKSFKAWLYKGSIVLEAAHPAAEAYSGGKAGFYGCGHFNKINEILKSQGKEPIKW